MKKLITAVAVAMVGIAVNAASCSWTVMPIETLDGATVTAAWGFDSTSLTQDAFLTLFAAGDTSWQTKGTEGMYDTGMAMGMIDGYANGASVSIWAAFLDDKGNVLVTDAATGTIGGAGQDPSPFIDTTAATAAGTFEAGAGAFAENGAGWYAPVPEPTSGLLLLLGMAGLALRRKQA